VLRLVHVDPAPLTTEIAAVGYGDIEKRRKSLAFLETLLEALD
jgi:hypothetical protein